MAKQKLTKAFIEGYPHPENGQIFFRDTQISGFGIKITKTAKTYFVERKQFGKTKRVTIGRHGELTLDEAKKQAKIKLGDLAKGIDVTRTRKLKAIEEQQQFEKSKQEHTTLKEAYKAFISWGKERKESTLIKYDRSIYLHLKCWLDTPLLNITENMVVIKYKALAKESPSSANHAMIVLGAVFKYAMKRLELNKVGLVDNPVDVLSEDGLLIEVSARTNFIKSHQLEEWWETTEQETPLLRDYLRFVLLTGIRRENAASLKWSDIDFKDKSFTILAKKKNVPLPLPLSKYLLSMLTTRCEQSNSQYVFPSTGKAGHLAEPRKAYKRIEDRTGIYATIHDLRRSFSKYGGLLKIPRYLVKGLLLHSLKGDVTDEHYLQHELEALREPSQRIEDFILQHVHKMDNVLPFTSIGNKKTG